MGHEDLERRLRSESGPREDGYAPLPLPAGLSAADRPTPPLLRWGLLGAAAAAAVVVVATATVLLAPPRESAGGPPPAAPSASAALETSPTPTPTAEPSAELAPCAASDFAVSTDPWDAGAGSRGTTVVLRLVDGAAPCTLAGAPAAGIDDANGQALVRSTPVAGTSSVLDPGQMVTVGLHWSNWCQDQPATPLRAWMVLSGTGDEAGAERIPLIAKDGGDVLVPPCMGAAGDPASMGITDFQPFTGPRPQG